jgi:enterochelin esterase-like enzyme
MALSGWGFPALLGLLAAAAFGALVGCWPRLSGPGAGHVAARAGALLGVNALVLLVAGALLNSEFLFFADWSDLAGAVTGTTVATSSTGGGRALAVTARHVRGRVAVASRDLPPLPADAGHTRWLTYTVHGAASGLTGRVVVSLPAGYTEPAEAHRRYPVLETFAGYPGRPEQWVETMHLAAATADAAAAGRLAPVVIVSPDTEFPAGADTECVNRASGTPQVETWLARDVPAWVAATFRVRTDRGSWATIGLSAGGWCAAEVTMRHPAQFAAAVVLGGYFRPQFGPWYHPLPPGGPQAEAYDLVALARRAPPPVAVWLQSSPADPTSYPTSAAFLTAARPPLAVRAVILQDAGHRMSVWHGQLPTSLTWLGTAAPGFTPAGP